MTDLVNDLESSSSSGYKTIVSKYVVKFRNLMNDMAKGKVASKGTMTSYTSFKDDESITDEDDDNDSMSTEFSESAKDLRDWDTIIESLKKGNPTSPATTNSL